MKKMPKKKTAQKKAVAKKKTVARKSPVAIQESPAIRLQHREDHVAILTFDRAHSSANIFDTKTLDLLDRLLDEIHDSSSTTGLILISAKDSIFIAGADLEALQNSSTEELRLLIIRGQQIFQKLADLKIPTVAAIHGICLGGGLEVALACDWRIASPDKKTKLGLPETQLGILPAWGGSSRLPRLIGLPQAIPLITSGKTLSAVAAYKKGIIDELVPNERLLDMATRLIHRGLPKRKHFSLTNNHLSAPLIGWAARKKILATTRGHYPAPLAALRVMTQGAPAPLDHSLEKECDEVLKLAQGKVAKNLMRVFQLQEHSRKLSYLPNSAPTPKHSIQQTAVIGAGVMGSGIAHWLSSRSYPVILQDISETQIASGISSISKLFAKAVKRRIMTDLEAKQARDLIHPSASPVPLDEVELVIEAATENMDIKKKIFQDLCKRTSPDTILATNTSALPISELTNDPKITHPERILGLHFFNPVHRMQLVEVVVPESTDRKHVEVCLKFLKSIGKLPVVVKDSPGFLVNRILLPYLIEAGRLYDSGVSANAIDRAMLAFGMPMGPIRLLDEIGLDVGLHVAGTLEDAFGERFEIPGILRRMVDCGHLGRKSGGGFYNYDSDASNNEANHEALECRRNDHERELSQQQIQDRLALLMANEAWRCLEEKVSQSADDIDFAMIMGTGFAPFRGGPMTWLQDYGLENACSVLDQLSASEGERFLPTDSLRTAAQQNADSASTPDLSTADTPPEPAKAPASSPATISAGTQVIDTSKMSPEQRAALELTEAARDKTTGPRSFSASLFMGEADMDSIIPFPVPNQQEEKRSQEFLDHLQKFLDEKVDADRIDKNGEIPASVINGLAKMGAFGIKIPQEYGGLGLPQTTYSRAAMLLGAKCGSLTALVSAHQSIGVPQPLILFGTEEQKQKYLPRCAAGEITAFALTEPDVGSDPAKMGTTATLSKNGKHYLINGEKLWCTNVLKAGLLVVMAKTPPPEGAPPSARSITAFIVEMDSPGIEITHRCRFMGLKALYNGVVTFKNVKVPAENIILGEGRGLKVALTTLNTGRITLPAACVGLAKECVRISTEWSAQRVQWGSPIGKHDAIAQKLAKMAAETFAMESIVLYTSGLVDHDKKADIRIEAAFGKLWGSERGWDIATEAMQIRGGRGYETAQSLKERGEEAIPIERFLRDSRINTIFEGSSEIMRLFIAREALDPHLNVGGAVLNSTLSNKVRFAAALNAAKFYAWWYPLQWVPALFGTCGCQGKMHPKLNREIRKVRSLSRKLARSLFHAMILNGPKLEKKQSQLGRFVDIGSELFAITATCSRAQQLLDRDDTPDKDELLQMVEYFCQFTRQKIDRLFRDLSKNADDKGYQVAKKLLQHVSPTDE
ncbi:MAG: 3-hydroxyacyl-CoA dehydrogenase NAD-binding domain-containing protein [Verrucomicrobiales bacterium]|nr:3-hydroxyacyl-CoA dehydrogenase NAD-binding domain-containing protein [Verrucomicrobiales bacterium]